MTQPKLSHEQETAVGMGSDPSNRIFSVTGGAGTGKTLVLGEMYRELNKRFKNLVVLAAPTGRAAKRIQELTKIRACTIHRLLEFPEPGEIDENTGEAPPNEPRRNAYRKLDQRIVIIDEASMLGPTLCDQLFDALPNNGAIRFFGDNNQLPPVESGEPPFPKLLRSYPSIELTFNFRSDDAIVGNALRILRGSVPLRNSRFEIIYSDDPIRQLYQLVQREADLFSGDQGQIIMPTRKGNFGTQRVNPTLQQWYNPHGPLLRLDRLEPKTPPIAVRSNDKFLWVKNDYNLGLFNGDIGNIVSVSPEDGSLVLGLVEGTKLVPARVRGYSSYLGHFIQYDPRKALELGYAVTTHKSQGSEFNNVVYCITASQGRLLNRQNFYTAITRARHRVIVIADSRGMRYSLNKAKQF